MLKSIFGRFSKRAPVALLFRGLFARAFSPKKLDDIFSKNRCWQVDSTLLFSTVVDIVGAVVVGAKPSVHASFIHHEEEVGVSKQAFYDKLAGIEVPVCEAMVAKCTAELSALLTAAKVRKPDLLEGYHCFVIDGKRLNGTEHRLDVSRYTKSAPLPGSIVAILDTRVELFVHAIFDPDAYANERKMLAPYMTKLEEGAVYLADRNFCDGPLIAGFFKANTFFVLRHHGRSPRWHKIVGCRKRLVGFDPAGQKVYEQEIEVQLPDKSWVRVRRITVVLATPTRDGDTELHLLTNLPLSVSALCVSEAYRGRWTIEVCLGKIASALNAEINTLSYPHACLFCFCLGLLAFNIISTLKQLLYRYNKTKQIPKLSDYYIALEIGESQLAFEICFDHADWKKLQSMTTAEFLQWVIDIAKEAKLTKYRTHTRAPKKPPPKRSSGKKRAHFSTHRALEEAL